MATTTTKIPIERVQSSNIEGIGYDGINHVLAVQFKSGAIFHFPNYDPVNAILFMEADSKGAFFAREIKRKVPGQKMTGKCPKCGDDHGWLGEKCSECGTAVYTEVETRYGKEAP
jgi:hypothetical protein